MMKDASMVRDQEDGATAEGPRILVVDDEASITDLVATVLRYEGFGVEVAANGWDALRLAADFRPDLVVLDVMLPDNDGFEVHRKLRDRGMAVPHIFLTARAATEDNAPLLTIGGAVYLA